MFKILPKAQQSYSPNLHAYKAQPKLTPQKIQGSPSVMHNNNLSYMNSIGTNRSTVAGSTASHYNSINAFNKTDTSLNLSGYKEDVPAFKASPLTKKIQHQSKLITTEKDDEEHCCINHPTKKAKYRVPHDQSVSFCSKCAVTMVGQGFKVEEINQINIVEQAQNKRRSEIQEFLEKVGRKIPDIEKMFYQLSQKKDEIRVYYEKQRTKIHCFFGFLSELLEQQKDNLEQKLQLNFQNFNTRYEEQLSELQQSMHEAGSMQKDIEQNIQKIITQIDPRTFNKIMSQYTHNLERFIGKLSDVQKYPVEVVQVSIPDLEEKQVDYKAIFTSLSEAVQMSLIKTSLLKRFEATQKLTHETQQSIDKNHYNVQQPLGFGVNTSLYVSFENKDQFQNNPKSKKVQPQPDHQTNQQTLRSVERQSVQNVIPSPNQIKQIPSPNPSKQPTRVRIATVHLYEQKQEEDKKAFRHLFQERNIETAFQKEDISSLDNKHTESLQSFEEGHSQMIEKDDIENTYNLMLCENESEQEELSQHIQEMNKAQQQLYQKSPLALFGSPQFKNI